MICVGSVGNQETIAGDMKQPKRLRKVSPSRERMLSSESGKNFLQHNSTIRRKPCDAMDAIKKSSQGKTFNRMTSSSTGQSIRSAPKDLLNGCELKLRKLVTKQSKKQQARLAKLALVRQRWWREFQETGKPLSCGICDEEIRSFEDLASDHAIPGSGKSDMESNLQPSHGICNLLKGSIRNFKIVRGDNNWKLIHGLL